jgi:hypothetical protein
MMVTTIVDVTGTVEIVVGRESMIPIALLVNV